MSYYPECAATPEEEGPQFEPPILGPAYQSGQRRLREAEAFSKVQRESHEFHERKARKYGLDHPVGLAHFKAARAYREAGGKLQEMFDAQNQGQQPDPKAMCKAHKSAVKFHKQQAQKAGLDSPLGQAHVNALQTHLGALNKLKTSIAGASGKQSPVPVPKKADQPNGDIRQNLPPEPLKKLQQNKREAINHFGEDEGGPGSGPRKGAGGKKPGKFARSDKELHGKLLDMAGKPGELERFHDFLKKNVKMEKEARPDTKSALPHRPNRTHLQDETDMFRARKMRPAAYGPKAAKPQIHGGTDQKGGTLDREARRSLRR